MHASASTQFLALFLIDISPFDASDVGGHDGSPFSAASNHNILPRRLGGRGKALAMGAS